MTTVLEALLQAVEVPVEVVAVAMVSVQMEPVAASLVSTTSQLGPSWHPLHILAPVNA